MVNWRDPEHSLAGGAEIYAWQFARALRDGGAEVEFLTAREPGQAATAVNDGIVVRRRGGAIGFYLFTALRLIARRRRIDAVIDPSCGLPTFAPLFVRRRTPVLLVMHHVHQDQFATHFPAPVAAFARWLERVLMPLVYRRSKVVAVSARPSTRCGASSAGAARSASSRTAPSCRRSGPAARRRRTPTGWRCSAGWSPTSGSTWCCTPSMRCARTAPDCGSTSSVRARSGCGSRGWPPGSGSVTGSRSTASSTKTPSRPSSAERRCTCVRRMPRAGA